MLIKVYDETIRVLKSAVENANLGHAEQVQALKRLDDQARRLEHTANGPSLESFIAGERERAPFVRRALSVRLGKGCAANQ